LSNPRIIDTLPKDYIKTHCEVTTRQLNANILNDVEDYLRMSLF